MKYKLSEIALFNPTETLKKGTLAKKIGMDRLQSFCRDIPDYEFAEFSGGTKFRNGDTIMARITPCLENGKTAKVNILDTEEVGFGSTEYIVFRAIEGITDEDYLYYLVCSPIVRDIAIKSMVGSSGRQRVQTDVVKGIEIELPTFDEQRKIGLLLKSLDDKIAINNKINENLQKQANLIFDELVGQHIPTMNDSNCSLQLHEIGNLDVLITDYVANGSFKSLADNVQYLSKETDNVLIRLTDYNNNFSSDMVYISDESYNFLSKSKLYGDEIIISNVGANVGTVFRCPRLNKRMSLAPNAIMLRSAKYEHYLYLYFISHYGQQQLQSIVTGSAQPKFNKTNFRSLKVVLPDETILNKITDMYNPMFEQIVANLRENKALVEIRDSLLPKLMSGELEVSGFQF